MKASEIGRNTKGFYFLLWFCDMNLFSHRSSYGSAFLQLFCLFSLDCCGFACLLPGTSRFLNDLFYVEWDIRIG